jgi:hypothetical protein
VHHAPLEAVPAARSHVLLRHKELSGVSGEALEVDTLPNGDYIVSVNIGYGDETATRLDGANGATLDGQNAIDPQNIVSRVSYQIWVACPALAVRG